MDYTTPETHTLALRIRAMRINQGLSRPALAEQIGFSVYTVKNYELGYRQPSAAIVEAIGHRFGPDWVLYVLGLGPQPEQA
jgi:transcriptional regulator with XRE-family HTH domain